MVFEEAEEEAVARGICADKECNDDDDVEDLDVAADDGNALVLNDLLFTEILRFSFEDGREVTDPLAGDCFKQTL